MNHLIKQRVVRLGQEADLPEPQSLPLALLCVRARPRVKEGVSPFEILYSRRYRVQKGITDRSGEVTDSEYMEALGKQLHSQQEVWVLTVEGWTPLHLTLYQGIMFIAGLLQKRLSSLRGEDPSRCW